MFVWDMWGRSHKVSAKSKMVERGPLDQLTLNSVRIKLENFTSCFATSYHWCFKEQLIDLAKEGCDLEIIDLLQPPKYPLSHFNWKSVSTTDQSLSNQRQTAGRFDCAATHVLRVFLLRSKKRRPEYRNIQEFERKVNVHNRFYPFDGDNDDYDKDDSSSEPESKSPIEHLNPIIDVFSEITSVEQWAGHAWKKVSHKFENYGIGLRYILFQSMGIDNQFWAGHYGPKMAKSSVTLTFQGNINNIFIGALW
uniref:FBA domain-containing protein n=1 Tax=Romanomermis culicivorax TaxID=13658 RepID=A0A915IFS6_ROMCU